MAGKYPSKAVANWDLQRFWKESRSMTQLQLNKLVYIAHGWHLALDPDGDGLISETVLAWKYGPVVPSLRDEFREFGSSQIGRLATDWVGDGREYPPQLEEYDLQGWELKLLEFVFKRYGNLSGPQLIELTHRPGTPWHQVTKGGTDIWKPMPNEIIRVHYQELLARLNERSKPPE